MKFAMFTLAAALAVSATQLKYAPVPAEVVDRLEEAQDDLIAALRAPLPNPDLQEIVKVT